MALVDLVIEDRRWDAVALGDLAAAAAEAALTAGGIETRALEIACLACDDARIAALNADFRRKPMPTNVLSWPAFDLAPARPGGSPSRDLPADPTGPTPLGDIAIAWETVKFEADRAQIPLNHHIYHLFLHATLHLLGYDHQAEADARLMEGLEVQALAAAGIPSPYDLQGEI